MQNQKEMCLDLPVLDRKSVNSIAWAKNMWAVLEESLNKTFLYWCQIVLKIGENEDVIKEWADVFIKAYEETSYELLTDMERVQGDVLSKFEKLLQEFEQLCQTLQVNMPVLGDKTQRLSLLQEQEQLIKYIDKYKNLIQVRRTELDKLRKKQSDLCLCLGIQPRILKDDPLPSCEEVAKFQDYIEKLETEKFNRLEKFCLIKEELLKITRELNIEPSSLFEKEVFSPDNTTFLVTDENMIKLDTLREMLIKEQKDVRAEIARSRIKVNEYWTLLDVDQIEREYFEQNYSGNSVDVLQALRTEIKRCKDLRRANIKVFVDKQRCELEKLWDRCHRSQTTETECTFLQADCYTEDLLERYDIEVTKWRKYYEENKELLTLLEKHKRMWNKMVQLDETTAGPNRYNNRGGQLLKEEKERNKLAKQIPQIENTLNSMADNYKRQHNDSFTTYGMTVSKYLANLHDEKENARKQKLSARKLQREQHISPLKSAVNLFPQTSTPSSSTKRKFTTPETDKVKKKVLSEGKNNKISKTATNTITMSDRSKRLSVERKKRIDKIRRLSSKKEKAKINRHESSSTDYGEFQIDLTNRTDSRSTLIPSEMAPSTPFRTFLYGIPTILITSPRTPRDKTPTNLKLG
ncbi:protein regulator of cytokinesis 1-like [Anoplophora glabripennis]|uniref:protein regulator of cytokinesis 1-like n=1 Tax=Anoplophora glabripennis TaxID=217634 RepID=UPI0008735547|nr:protein regulator of cytokinesis 1-like [Anoplophora glabripennis]